MSKPKPGREEVESAAAPTPKPRTAEEERKRRVRRSFAAQAIGCSAKNLVLYSWGSVLGFITIIQPDIRRPPFNLTEEEISWFGSSNWICTAMGGLVSGTLSAPFGRKPAMIFVNLVFITSCLIFFFANSVPTVFMGQSLGGFAGGLLEGPCLTYIGEITEPQYRGMMSSTTVVIMLIGIMASFVFGSFISWRTVALINIIAPICAIILLLVIPESPHWLMVRGKEEKAEKCLRWLRGWATSEEVKEEMDLLRRTLGDKVNRKPFCRRFSPRDLCKRNFYLPYSICAFVFAIGHWSGMTPLQTFAVTIFSGLHGGMNAYTSTILIGLIEFIGGSISFSVVHFTGKRKLTFISLIGCSISFIGAGTFFAVTKGMVSTIESSEEEMMTWVKDSSSSILAYASIICLICSAMFSHLMIRILPWILIGEIYPPEVKGFASGLSGASGYIFGFSANKSFLPLARGLSVPGVFFLYGAVGLIGCAILYFVLPETEGRKLHEILTFFDGTGNFKERGMLKKNKASEQE